MSLFQNIDFPSKGEVIRAIRAAENGAELTDRELWILSELEGDFE